MSALDGLSLLNGRYVSARAKNVRPAALEKKSGERGGENYPGEMDLEKIESNKCAGSEHDERAMVERATPNAQDGFSDDGDDHALDAIEKAADDREIAAGDGKPAQEKHDEDGRDDEERAGDDASERAVHARADVDGELLRFRPGENHAKIEGAQELLLANPLLPLDEFAVHDGDLPGGAAEIDEAELEPESEGFGKWNARRQEVSFGPDYSNHERRN